MYTYISYINIWIIYITYIIFYGNIIYTFIYIIHKHPLDLESSYSHIVKKTPTFGKDKFIKIKQFMTEMHGFRLEILILSVLILEHVE